MRKGQVSKVVSIDVIRRHNRHDRITWADPELSTARAARRAEREKRDAEWEMTQGWKVRNLPRGE